MKKDRINSFLHSRNVKKLLLTMKLIIVLLVVGLMQVSATVYSQATKFNLSVDNKQIAEVLKEIEESSNFRFFYIREQVNVERRVSVKVNNATVEQILDELFTDEGINYRVMEDYLILLSPENISADNAKMLQQQKSITGKVTDETGQPLPGVTVFVKGTTKGTVTNADGNYSISSLPDDAVLVFSFIGMKTLEITVGEQTNIDITMEVDISNVDEVIVTGYQTISKERATGSYVQVKQKDMESFYDSNVSSLLEGKVAGLSTYGGKIVIRGVSTFNANSNPLIVVDGLPSEGQGLDDINPNDIASITVLKDAAASSIYGVRAANGVIVVTTKLATKGKTTVDFSMNYTMTPVDNEDFRNILATGNYIDYETSYLNTIPSYVADPLAYFDEQDQNNRWYSPVYYLYSELARGNMTEAEVNASITELKGRDEYRKQYIENAIQDQLQQQYNLSFRTATEKSNIVLSLNALTNKSSQINNKSETYTLYFKNNLKFYDWLSVGYGLNTVISKNESPAGRLNERAQPYEQLVDANGNRVYRDLINQTWADNMRTPENIAMGLYDMKYNALDELDANMNTNTSNNTRMFLNANLKFTDYLSYDVMFQYNFTNRTTKRFYDEESYQMRNKLNLFAEFTPAPVPWLTDSYVFNLPKGGQLHNSATKQNSYTLRNQINFNKVVNTDHAITVLAGFEINETKYESQLSEIYGYDDQTLNGVHAIDWSPRMIAGALLPSGVFFVSAPFVERNEVVNRYVSIYANGGYTYKGKYSATASFRIDQTNLFGTDPEYRYRPLWSVGASWLLSNEDFMTVDWINYLKLRTSYGVGGNVDKTTSPYLLAGLRNSFSTGNPTTIIHTPPNPFLRWEKTTTYNVGVDFAMFGSRLSGSVEAYWKNSEDLLTNKSMDPSLGFTTAVVNNGAMTNNGIELSLNYTWLSNADWTVSTMLTAAYNKNIVTKVDYDPSVANDLLGRDGYYLQGAAFSSLYAYQYEGLDENGDPLVHDIIEDADGNDKDTIIADAYVQNYEALLNMGQTEPKWVGSFQPVVRYKGFELSALLTFYTGNVMRDNVTGLYRNLKGGYVHGDLVNAWTSTNTNTDIPRMASQNPSDGYRNQNWRYANTNIVDASTVNLRNIVLSYSLRPEWAKVVKASMVRVNFQINNPWYWQASLLSSYTKRSFLPLYVFGVNVNF